MGEEWRGEAEACSLPALVGEPDAAAAESHGEVAAAADADVGECTDGFVTALPLRREPEAVPVRPTAADAATAFDELPYRVAPLAAV